MTVPFYEFSCNRCETVYEELCSHDPKGKYPGLKCPKCGSKSKTKLMSTCNYAFANPEGTDRWNSESGGHDYRFNHNLPKVIAERQNAAEKGGNASPYNKINDLNNNDVWGEVK